MFSTDTKLPDAAVGPAGSNIFVLLPRRSRIALVAAHPAVFFFSSPVDENAGLDFDPVDHTL